MSRRNSRLAGVTLVLAMLLTLSACASESEDPATEQAAETQDDAKREAGAPREAPAQRESDEASPRAPQPKRDPAPAFDRTRFSIDDPASPWVVVNKRRPFDPLNHAPSDLVFPEGISNRNGQPLRAEAATAVSRMFEAAQADEIWFQLGSAYRDYSRQEYLYASYIARDGQAAADTYSARPGYSEHQTGLVVDFDDGGSCYLMWCFADTDAGRWLAEHAAEYGWILRYPESLDHITGYTFEPWHYRYVGAELALEMKRQGVATLEEFFGLEPAPDYGS